jgi:hypothetical protein
MMRRYAYIILYNNCSGLSYGKLEENNLDETSGMTQSNVCLRKMGPVPVPVPVPLSSK